MKQLSTIKMVLLIGSGIVYFLIALFASSLGSSGSTSVLYSILLALIIFPLLVFWNISVYGCKWIHVCITPLVLFGSMMVTDIVDTIVGYEVHTQVFEGRTYEDKSSIYFRKGYGFTHYEFLILLSIFLFIINVYPVARFRKIP